MRRFAVGIVLVAGCRPTPTAQDVTPTVAAASEKKDPLAILDELESLIDKQGDSEEDRVYAYDQVRAIEDDGSAAWAFARGALAGRLAELRGAGAGKLVTEAEEYARLSLERDAQWRERAATRMLGTLYVMAPPRLVEHGDSEAGLAMLEELVAAKPEDTRNHLRVAEAYIFLGDPDPSLPYLCTSVAGAAKLRADDQRLLDRLVEEMGGAEALGCAPS